MKVKFICLAVLALSLAVTAVFGQTGSYPSTKEIGVDLIVPEDEAAPVEILSPAFRTNEMGHARFGFAIRNRSTKMISRIVLEEISWLGHRQESRILTSNMGEYFLPGETLSNFSEGDVEEKLSDSTVAERSLSGSKDLVVFFVSEAEFADGTIYRSPVDARTIREFCIKLSIRRSMADDDLHEREASLRQFLKSCFSPTSGNKKNGGVGELSIVQSARCLDGAPGTGGELQFGGVRLELRTAFHLQRGGSGDSNAAWQRPLGIDRVQLPAPAHPDSPRRDARCD